jgi:hypothetical protein
MVFSRLSTAACVILSAVVFAATDSIAGPSAGDQEGSEVEPRCELPAKVRILPNNLLILQSERDSLAYTGTQVSISLDKDGRILLDGRPLLPDASRRREFSDVEVQSLLGSVPFVADLVASGRSRRQAGQAYMDSVDAITSAYRNQWIRDRAQGVSFKMAAERLLDAFQTHPFLDVRGTYLEGNASSSEIIVTVSFVGGRSPVTYWFHDDGFELTPLAPTVDRRHACALLAQLRKVLEQPTGVNAIKIQDGLMIVAIGQKAVQRLTPTDRRDVNR